MSFGVVSKSKSGEELNPGDRSSLQYDSRDLVYKIVPPSNYPDNGIIPFSGTWSNDISFDHNLDYAPEVLLFVFYKTAIDSVPGQHLWQGSAVVHNSFYAKSDKSKVYISSASGSSYNIDICYFLVAEDLDNRNISEN